MIRSLVIGLIVAVASPALAQPSATPAAVAEKRRDRAVSVGTASLQGFGGIAVAYEQLAPGRRWSWLAGGGLRSGARGDFASLTLAAGGEARYWLKGRAVWADEPPRSMIGWYVGGRLDLAWTRTVDQIDDRAIGDNLGLAVTGTLGYRFLIRRRVEITPMVGLGVTRETDLGGRLPGFTRGTGRLGMSIGWMF